MSLLQNEVAEVIAADILNRVDGAGSDLEYAEWDRDGGQGVWIEVHGNLDVQALAATVIAHLLPTPGGGRG